MRSRMRDQKGITVVALVITVAVLIVVTTTMVIGISSRYESQRLDKLSSDLRLLKDKVLIYYTENGNFPIIEETLQEESKYEIDLSKLDGLTLNYGNKVGGDENDVYLIDITKGEISYKKGIDYKDTTYNTLITDDEVSSVTASDVLKITNQQVTIKDGSGNEVAQKEQVLNKSHIISIYNRETVSITANVNVSDLDEIVYEWYRNDKLISGASTQTYEISEPENNDTYYCKVTYNGASKNSTKFILRNDRKIPSNYQQVEYIGAINDTTNGFCNSLKLDSAWKDVSKINTNFRISKVAQTATMILCTYTNSTNRNIPYIYSNNSSGYVAVDSSGAMNNFVVGNPVYTQEELATETFKKVEFLVSANTNEGIICFGSWCDRFYSASWQCKSIQVYDTTNNLIKDFIPCYRISDNVIGMYDIINDVFYTNEGTGTFVMGNEVN